VVLFFHPDGKRHLFAAWITDFGLGGRGRHGHRRHPRRAGHMIRRQIPQSLPDIKMIVPHLGGLIPMLLKSH